MSVWHDDDNVFYKYLKKELRVIGWRV